MLSTIALAVEEVTPDLPRQPPRRSDRASPSAPTPTGSAPAEPPAALLLLGFVLGPLLEEHLRRAMIISRGDPMIFLTRPISATLLALALAAVVFALLLNAGPPTEWGR